MKLVLLSQFSSSHGADVQIVLNPQDFLIVNLAITKHEFQSILISRDFSTVYLRDQHWHSQISSLLKRISIDHTPRYKLDNVAVLLGTWHYGHLIGDHSTNILYHILRRKSSYILAPSTTSISWASSNLLVSETSFHSYDHPLPVIYEPSPFTTIYCPSFYPISSLCTAHTYLNSQLCSNVEHFQRIFLTSERNQRILNSQKVIEVLSRRFTIINPLKFKDKRYLYSLIRKSDIVVTENGSILFNLFVSRNHGYHVLASRRSTLITERNSPLFAGGACYNKFHHNLINYLVCPQANPNFDCHPYSDQLDIPDSTLEHLMTL